MLFMAFAANLVIVICEFLALGHIKEKGDILKYYTYLQNFLAMIASLFFCVFLPVCLTAGKPVPEFMKGLRYVTTCGLLAAMFVFLIFLGAGKKVSMTEDDFLCGFRPKTANFLLHYLCPVLSLVSFLLFEREIAPSHDIWTAIAPIPSCVYWITYLILSATKSWEEPYCFASAGEKTGLRNILSVLLIPLSFIAISYFLWNIP